MTCERLCRERSLSGNFHIKLEYNLICILVLLRGTGSRTSALLEFRFLTKSFLTTQRSIFSICLQLVPVAFDGGLHMQYSKASKLLEEFSHMLDEKNSRRAHELRL